MIGLLEQILLQRQIDAGYQTGILPSEHTYQVQGGISVMNPPNTGSVRPPSVELPLPSTRSVPSPKASPLPKMNGSSPVQLSNQAVPPIGGPKPTPMKQLPTTAPKPQGMNTQPAKLTNVKAAPSSKPGTNQTAPTGARLAEDPKLLDGKGKPVAGGSNTVAPAPKPPANDIRKKN